ncbi:MAG: TRASH domain-containing protein [Spirochaetota bacterium]
MKKLFLIISAALITGLFVQAADVKAAKTDVKGTVQNYASTQAKVGDTVICPVMKEGFKVTDKSLSVSVKGKKYFICCAKCEGELKKNPDKYLTPAKDDKKSAVKKDEHPKGEHPKNEHPSEHPK